ncbi:MAG: hypothetical protein ACI9C2_002251 [Gammaproteobacteria bacterium]|jgi:hypothetical protein
MSKVTYIFGALLGATSIASAQVADVFIVDTSNDQLIRLSDIDGDGQYYSSNEASRFYSDGTLGTASTQEAHAVIARDESGTSVAYWVDRKTTAIYRGTDVNNNGLIDIGEETLFRDTGTLDDPNADFFEGGLTFANDGSIWYSTNWNSSTPHTGVYRLMDLNADGDAADAGELQAMAEFGNGLTTTPSSGTPVTVDMEAFTRLTNYNGGIVGWTGTSGNFDEDFCLYSFEDLNSDGDVQDAGETKVFLNPSGRNVGLDMNVDFAGGVLRSQEAWDQGVAPIVQSGWNRFRFVTTLVEGGKDIVYIASDASDNSFFGFNQAGEGLNGLIYRCEDLNLDGDAQDAGEVTLYFDGSSTSGGNLFPKLVGMAGHGSSIYVAPLLTSATVWRLEDLNGDGDAMDAGEVFNGIGGGLWDADTYGISHGDYPVPFDPVGLNYFSFVRQIGICDAGLWSIPSTGFVTSGTGCSLYGPDLPVITASGAPQIGTANFVTQVSNAPANMPAVLTIGFNSASWLGLPLPFDLTAFGYSGCTLYHNWVRQEISATVGSGALGGVGTQVLPIPNLPGLVGIDVHLQWAILNVIPGGFQLGLTGLGTFTIE